MANSGSSLREEEGDARMTSPLDLVRLTSLMERSVGRPETAVALIDGPVAMAHPSLATEMIRAVPGSAAVAGCVRTENAACGHGTFVAGILSGRRGSAAPAICPGCTLLVRPVFTESAAGDTRRPQASPGELAAAIIECIAEGARVVNLSLALSGGLRQGVRELEGALDHAMRRGVIVVAAAGNQGAVGGTAIVRHPWVIPVVACDLAGRPAGGSNLGGSIGRGGLRAPGDGVTSLGAAGAPLVSGGTSVAAPFVSGTLALLLSEFPRATGAQAKLAVTAARGQRRATIVPALLDAWSAYRFLAATLP
jgi:subtilisin family serine protease